MPARPLGLLEPDARMTCTSGSEGAWAQQCARATRRDGFAPIPFCETSAFLQAGCGVGSKHRRREILTCVAP